jgi:tetratricopeptide (TPR) repeat protein
LELDPDTTARQIAATDLRKKGYKALQSGELDSAITAFNQAIKLDPNSADAYILRGDVYAQKRDWDRTLADYSQGIKLKPNNAEAYFHCGVAYRNKGDWARALADYEQTVKLNPNAADAHLGRGVVYYQKGDLDRSIVAYSEALRLDPNLFDGHNNLAFVLFDLGRFEEAQRQWEEELRLSPHADARTGKAIALEAQGNRSAALETYRLAVEEDKSYWDCTLLREQFMWSEKACQAAQPLIEALRSSLPQDFKGNQ